MNTPSYWKSHYVLQTDADKIEAGIKHTNFSSDESVFEMPYFERGEDAPSILISQGSGGHSYVFAELGYKMHLRGFNVFIMPKHGDGFTIGGLVRRHRHAVEHISKEFNDQIGVFAEGLGGFAAFYLALDHAPVRSLVCQNSPGILTEERFLRAVTEGDGAWSRKRSLPLFKAFAKLFPNMRLSISFYLDWIELIDPKEPSREVETRLVLEGYLKDPDFDKKYRLSSIMSQISTPPPNPLTELRTPTMFMLATRGVFPSYIRDLYGRLPPIKKRMVEVDGSVYWMLSHPLEAAKVIYDWFDETLCAGARPSSDFVEP